MNSYHLPRVPGQYPEPKRAEGAYQIQNGKWRSTMFPGRDFDDLDEYRAAKKQRAAWRKEYSAQNGLPKGWQWAAAEEVVEAPPQRADVESVTEVVTV